MNILIVLLLCITGIYFSFKLKFKNFDILSMIKNTFKKEKGISKFASLCISLSSKIGVGSLSGVALAIYFGGVGTIFWMWVITILTSANTMAESILSMKYRIRNNDTYEGGVFYYIKNGLKNIKLAKLYAIIFLISYAFGFLTIQVNTISTIVIDIIYIPKIMIGIILSILVSLVVFGGIKEISKVVTKLIPIITIIYITTCLIIIFKNITLIDDIIILIIKSAFNKNSFLTSLLIGSTKCIFSIESGLGTSSIASSITTSNDIEGSSLVQTLGVYFDTFVVTTLTAFVIILSSYTSLNLNDINGIEITSYAFTYGLGKVGNLILLISIILFALSTIIGDYYYIEVAYKFLFKNKLIIYKIIFILIIITSTIISPKIIWKSIDNSIILLGLINILSLLLLKDDVKYRKVKK